MGTSFRNLIKSAQNMSLPHKLHVVQNIGTYVYIAGDPGSN